MAMVRVSQDLLELLGDHFDGDGSVLLAVELVHRQGWLRCAQEG